MAVCCADFTGHTGTAVALGECPAVAALDAPASGRLSVIEAVLNILAADIDSLADIKLSANWMADSSDDAQLSLLYETVQAVSQLCQSLQLTIPVGKDSLFMKKQWRHRGRALQSSSPVSLVVSAFLIDRSCEHQKLQIEQPKKLRTSLYARSCPALLISLP